MRKELNINFVYEEKDGSFEPIGIDYEDVNHSILAFCIAGILYEEDKKKPCFSSHVADDIRSLKEED
ncbi:hypothetical protein [Lactococcus sp.]|uniref:hypothetical protein n=1 Tax=Lactococcus sp. TaxID=44273 RepID=UPI002FC91A92